MTAWTAHHIDSLRVKAVLCTGDLVDQNECILPPFPRFGNLTSREQWTFVSRAFGRLDNKVPYLISTGNHDYGYTRSENSMTRFPEYFPIERNSQWKKTIVAATNNRNGLPTLENAAMEITDEHWGRILIIAVEFAPRDEVLSWARELVATPRFKDHTVILITHSYLTGFDSKRITKEGYKITPSNTGEGIWQKLVQPSANIRLVLCGHYATPNERLDYTTGFPYRQECSRTRCAPDDVQLPGVGWRHEWKRGRRLAASARIPARRTYGAGQDLFSAFRLFSSNQGQGMAYGIL